MTKTAKKEAAPKKKKPTKTKEERVSAPKKKRAVKKAIVLEALPGETRSIKEVIVAKGQHYLLKHSGGTLKIGRIVVEAGGKLTHDTKNKPADFSWGSYKADAGSTIVNKF